MRIQVVATITANGYLLKRENKTNRIGSSKYGFSALQEHADLTLHKESSLIALLEEKRQSSDTNYLVEAVPETLNLIKGLFLYRLVDELILYMIPNQRENDIKLFDLTSSGDWILVKEFPLKNVSRCFIYHRIK